MVFSWSPQCGATAGQIHIQSANLLVHLGSRNPQGIQLFGVQVNPNFRVNPTNALYPRYPR